MSLASAVTRTPSCSQHVSWSWSQTTDRCGEKARPNVCPPPFIVVSVHRHACQLIKLCSENATFYRRQSIVYRQWHPIRTAGRIAADSIMAARPSPMVAVGAEYSDSVLRSRASVIAVVVPASDSEALPSHYRRSVCCFRYVYVVRHALVMITIRRSAETKVHLPFFVFANGVCATTSQSRSFRVHLPHLPCFYTSAYSLQQSLQYATTGSGSLIIPRVTCFGLTSH